MGQSDSHLPPAAFVDPDVFQTERREIFAREWLAVGRDDGLASAGDYLSVGLGGWPAFLIRDEVGELRAFRNICRHQQLPVLENGRGHCETMRCRYHGWTYDFAGRLVHAPPAVCPPDLETTEYRLDAINSARAGPLVFLNLQPQAPRLDTALADIATTLPDDGHGHAADTVHSLAANWKAVVGALLDGPGSWSRDFTPRPPRGDTAIIHQDGDRAWAWHWPTLVLFRSPEASLVQIVMPRTFTKTEIHQVLHLAADLPASRTQYWRSLLDTRSELANADAVERQQEIRATARGGGTDAILSSRISPPFATRWSAAMAGRVNT